MIRKREHSDGFSGIGTVTIHPFKLLPDGKKSYLPFTKNNLIVEAGRAALIDALTGVKTRKLSYIRWGKGGALSYPDGDPLNPLPVEDKDTDVKNFLIDKPLSPFKRTSPTEVEYVETLICDEVDDDVSEAVMLLEDQESLERSIFARITFPTVRLTIAQGTGIEIRWVFSFTKAEEVEVAYEEPPIEVPPENDDTDAPAEVTNVAHSIDGTTVTLTWTNPLDEDFSHVVVTRNGAVVGAQIEEGSFSESITVSGGHTYILQTVDINGNMSDGIAYDLTV